MSASDTRAAAPEAAPLAPVLEAQRSAIRSFQAAEQRIETAEAAARRGREELEKQAQTATQARDSVRGDLERVRQAFLLNLPGRASGVPRGMTLDDAVTHASAAVEPVREAVKALERWRIRRLQLILVGGGAGLAGAVVLYAVLNARVTGTDVSAVTGDTTSVVVDTALPAPIPIPTFAESTVVSVASPGEPVGEPERASLPEARQLPPHAPPAPLPPPDGEPAEDAYAFALRDIADAQQAFDRGEYVQVRRTLRGTYDRLESLANRYPRSRRLRELKSDALYLITRAGTACEAERSTGQQPGDCN